ncbi:MAG: diphthamide biosynthesis enzyme Dph2 [Candidatus Hydrothermarchaeales archaeon]
MDTYDFELDRIIKIVKDKKYSVIGLQFPEGLKDYAAGIADEVSKAGCEVIISSDPCYGACDLADEEMHELGVDALFHFGHAEILSKTAIPVFYIEVRINIDPIPLVSKNLAKLPKKIGLVTTVQHVHFLEKVKKYLEDNGYQVHIGIGRGRTKYDGQVLGCSFIAAKSIADQVDAFLYLGSGDFHPLGVALATGKKTLAFDVLLREVRDISKLKEKILKQRYARIAKATQAETFGIIVGSKRGQRRKKLALEIKRKLEEKGKKAYLLYLNEITPDNLMSFRKLDALVNTACPRIVIEDAQRYKQPMLTPMELEILLEERGWEDYVMDEF